MLVLIPLVLMQGMSSAPEWAWRGKVAGTGDSGKAVDSSWNIAAL